MVREKERHMTMNLAEQTSDTAPGSRYGSEAVTQGIRIRVVPAYIERHSSPFDRKFAYAYRILITNESDRRVRLESRHWIIVDGHGRREEVRGEGVIGQNPALDPGESFEYASHCLLKCEWGTMEGTYRFHPEGAEPFDAEIARFYLVAEATSAAEATS